MYAAIYCRKSVDTQRGESMQSQLSYCKAYLAAHRSAEDAAHAWVYRDEGFSGAALRRPAMQRLLRDVRAHLISCVVCYRLDRISRSVADFTALMEEFARFHVDFLCASEEFDTAKPMGRAMLYIASVFSQLERETLAERVRDNMYTLATDGRWLGGPSPYGYRTVRVGRGVGEASRKPRTTLIPDAAEQAVLRRIFTLYAERASLERVVEGLGDTRNRQGNLFTPRYLRSILRSPVYAAGEPCAADYLAAAGDTIAFTPQLGCMQGMCRFGKRPNHGVAMPLVVLGEHPALLTGAQWCAFQRCLGGVQPRTGNGIGLLRQLLQCAQCGGEMLCKPRSGQSGVYDYICKAKYRARACDCRNLNGAAADARVWESLCNALEMPAVVRAARKSDRRALLQICVKNARWDGETLVLILHGGAGACHVP